MKPTNPYTYWQGATEAAPRALQESHIVFKACQASAYVLAGRFEEYQVLLRSSARIANEADKPLHVLARCHRSGAISSTREPYRAKGMPIISIRAGRSFGRVPGVVEVISTYCQ